MDDNSYGLDDWAYIAMSFPPAIITKGDPRWVPVSVMLFENEPGAATITHNGRTERWHG